ncbi:hypothetical protein DVH24_009856 [Malus domestica]|uniref:Uncharacterized protein n=1 Tax=Malus domestica TaxID=3750 RepID=A0A498KQ31_MALDO|nr:hypothetical protein DVH24_009856 [Malus domestica]
MAYIYEVPIGLYGFQHYLSMLGSIILIPLVIVPAMGELSVQSKTIRIRDSTSSILRKRSPSQAASPMKAEKLDRQTCQTLHPSPGCSICRRSRKEKRPPTPAE